MSNTEITDKAKKALNSYLQASYECRYTNKQKSCESCPIYDTCSIQALINEAREVL